MKVMMMMMMMMREWPMGMMVMPRNLCRPRHGQIKVSGWVRRSVALNCLTTFLQRNLDSGRLLTGYAAASKTSRAASTQPASLAGTTRSQADRLGSEPPSDTRSFIEEYEVYRSARFSTPRAQDSPSPAPRPPQQSATRSSARLAARNSVPRESSVEMTPSKGRGLTTRVRPLVSDSIDEEDDTDPLHTPRRRGVRDNREPSSQPPTSEASRGWTRPEDLERNSESPSPAPRPPLGTLSSGQKPDLRERIRMAGLPHSDDESAAESDESDGEPTPTAKRGTREEGGNNRPNPIQDARSGDLVLPRPDRPGTQPSPGRHTGRPQPEQRVEARNEPLVNQSPINNLSKSPVAKSPQRQPPSQPPLQRQLYPRLPPQPQPEPPTEPRPSLLQSPPRRPTPQSRPGRPSAESRADAFSNAAKAPEPIASAFSNQPAVRHRRDDADARPSGQHQAPASPAPAAPAEPQEPVLEEPRFDFFRRFAHGTKYEDLLDKALRMSWIILKLWALLAAASILYLIFIDCVIPIRKWDGIRVHRDFDYGGVSSWRQKVLQIIPWVVLHPFSVLTGNLDYADYRTVLNGLDLGVQTHELRLATLSAATWQMRRVLPELIKVNVKSSTGEWAVDDEFWNALDAEMHEGGLMYSLLTMEKSYDGTYSISDTHWNAIKQRIEKDHTLVSDRPASEEGRLPLSDQVAEYVNQHTSKVWADWLKANQDAIGKMQGKPGGIPSRTYQELYGDLEEVMNKRLKALGLEQGVVTRDEFIAKFEDSIANHKSEIKTELENLRSKLGQALGIAMEARAAADVPYGVPREEVEEMIDQAMRRAISDAVLEAIAKGHIKSHLDQEIVHKKNYFNTHRGALIDQSMTSAAYNWGPKDDPEPQTQSRRWFLFPRTKSQAVFREGGGSMGHPNSPSSALEKWSEDGECWCAGLSDSDNVTTSANLGIYTTDSVIPQYLVVEHIDAGASFDPKSTPRDIEFWIRAPQDKRARTLDHWSKERWPAARHDAASRRLLDRGYAKIGQFVYDNTLGGGESQVFRFPRELLDMDAQTQQVLVRATTNYGAEDHTCFYRLRLFGEEPAAAASLKDQESGS